MTPFVHFRRAVDLRAGAAHGPRAVTIRSRSPAGKTSELLVRLALDPGATCAAIASSRTCGVTTASTTRPQHVAVEGGQAAAGARRSPCDRPAATAGTRLAVEPSEQSTPSRCWPRRRGRSQPSSRRGRGPAGHRAVRCDLDVRSTGELLTRRGRRRLGRATSGPAGSGPGDQLVEASVRRPAALGDAERRDQRSGTRPSPEPSVPRRTLGPLDHRPVPGGAAGRCARRRTSGCVDDARRRARTGAGTRAPATRATDPRPRRALGVPDLPAGARPTVAIPGNLPALDPRPSSGATPRSTRSCELVRGSPSGRRSSARAASARRRVAVEVAAGSTDRPSAGGGVVHPAREGDDSRLRSSIRPSPPSASLAARPRSSERLQVRHRPAHPRQLRTCPRATAADWSGDSSTPSPNMFASCAPARCRSTSLAQILVRTGAPWVSTTPSGSSASAAAQRPGQRAGGRGRHVRRTSVGPSTAYRWPSSWPRPGQGRCRSRRSRIVSMIASPC